MCFRRKSLDTSNTVLFKGNVCTPGIVERKEFGNSWYASAERVWILLAWFRGESWDTPCMIQRRVWVLLAHTRSVERSWLFLVWFRRKIGYSQYVQRRKFFLEWFREKSLNTPGIVLMKNLDSSCMIRGRSLDNPSIAQSKHLGHT